MADTGSLPTYLFEGGTHPFLDVSHLFQWNPDILAFATPKAVYDYFVGPFGADPRVENWPLLNSPWPPIALSVCYLLVGPLGRVLMKDREPFNVKRFATLHNAILLAVSLYMAVETVSAAAENFGWWGYAEGKWTDAPNARKPDGPILCEPVEKLGYPSAWSPSGLRLARVLYIHYLSKAYEFVDTVLMVLKKNFRQVTFLHVYHHATTFFPVWYWTVKYGPGGAPWFCCMLNSSVHVVMYSYYLATSLGVRVPKPFKAMITLGQLTQFVSFIVQGYWLVVVNDCYHPRLPPFMLQFQCVVFFVLFLNFFIRAYCGGKGKGAGKGKVKDEAAAANGHANGHANGQGSGTLRQRKTAGGRDGEPAAAGRTGGRANPNENERDFIDDSIRAS